MNKVINVASTVVGILFAIFGVITGFSALLGLGSAGLAGVAQSMATQVNRSAGDFPTQYAVIGGALILVLSALYLVTSFGLLKKTTWAPICLIAVGIVGFCADFIVVGQVQTLTIVWSAIYIVLGAAMMAQPQPKAKSKKK